MNNCEHSARPRINRDEFLPRGGFEFAEVRKACALENSAESPPGHTGPAISHYSTTKQINPITRRSVDNRAAPNREKIFITTKIARKILQLGKLISC